MGQSGGGFSPWLFLKDLKARLDAAETDEVRQQITMAARFGLAALDHRDLDS